MVQRSTIEQLRDFDTALVANTLDYLDPTPQELWYMGGSIRSVTPSLGPTVGVAVTCEIDSSTPGGAPDIEGFWRQLDEIAEMELPAVWVVCAVGSRPDHECIMGDGMAKLLLTSGCVGIVTDGGVRDVPGMLTTPFAAYCRGTVIHHAAVRVRSTGRPVEVGGITVSPGDLIHAGPEGVIKVPPASLEVLPQKLSLMRQVEHEVHRVWRRTDLTNPQKRSAAADVFHRAGFIKA